MARVAQGLCGRIRRGCGWCGLHPDAPLADRRPRFPSAFQFGIRSLLIFTLVVALPFSWLAVEVKAAREQKKAVDEIARDWMGGCPMIGRSMQI